MLITPLLFIAYDRFQHLMDASKDTQNPDDIDEEQGHILIAGIGRFGQVINRLVQMAGFKTVVLDNDLQTIQLMRTFGFKGFSVTQPALKRCILRGCSTPRFWL